MVDFPAKARRVHGNKYGYEGAAYSDCKTPVEIRCPVHGSFWQTPDSHINKRAGCPECGAASRAKNQALTLEKFLAKATDVHGGRYDYGAVTFGRSTDTVTIGCPVHGPFRQRVSNHLAGRGCQQCAHETVGLGNAIDQADFLERALQIHGDKYDYRKVQYFKSSSKVSIRCPEHGLFGQRPNNHLTGQGCPACGRVQSAAEDEIERLIQAEGYATVRRSRDIIAPREIDILVPTAGLGIEYCGLHWHGEAHGRGRNYHVGKYLAAKERGIALLTVFGDEWLAKRHVVRQVIRAKLGRFDTRVGARRCQVVRLLPDIAREFMMRNHLAGYDPASLAYGLEFQGTLVSAMTFKKPRFNRAFDWEISRFASQSGTFVAGGASRIIAAFVRDHSHQSIISYADLRYGEGQVYAKAGFRLLHRSPPNYWYCKDGQHRESRLKYQKHKISQGWDTSLSERQIMAANGYDRIFDCGSNVWGRGPQ